MQILKNLKQILNSERYNSDHRTLTILTVLVLQLNYCCNYREMDPALEEPIATILWAAPRLMADVPELAEVWSFIIHQKILELNIIVGGDLRMSFAVL